MKIGKIILTDVLVITTAGFSFSLKDRPKSIIKKPNVLNLFSDQHNKRVMRFSGHTDIITPGLDKPAGESVVSDRAFFTRDISALSWSSLMIGLYSMTPGLL
jgi:arylsulfatase A-like enzyme